MARVREAAPAEKATRKRMATETAMVTKATATTRKTVAAVATAAKRKRRAVALARNHVRNVRERAKVTELVLEDLAERSHSITT